MCAIFPRLLLAKKEKKSLTFGMCVQKIDLKLGMLGVTVVYASGDYGVAGNGGACLDGGVRVSLCSDFPMSSVMHRSPLVSNSSTRGFDAKLRCANSGLIVLLSMQVVPVCLPIHYQYRRYSGEMNAKPSALDLTFFCRQVSPGKTVNDPEEAASNGNFSIFFGFDLILTRQTGSF